MASKGFDLRSVDGVGPVLFARARKQFPRDEWRDAPYRLCEIHGFGFLRADRVARKLGVGQTSKERVNAGAKHLLDEAEQGGHTCLPVPEFSQKLLELLEIRLFDFEFDEQFCEQDGLMSLQRTYDAEMAVATQAKILLGRPTPSRDLVSTGGLHADQRDALAVIQNANMFVLLGGPGTGKTHLIQRIAESRMDGKVALCAPTGKASKRIEELSGMRASTIHRLLEPCNWKTGGRSSFSRGFKFARNRMQPLDAEIVIVDEASMCDVRLLADLMDALPPNGRLILVGDPFQLPSVGAGAVLRDLVASGAVPQVELVELKRQDPKLLIARNCQEIRWRKRVIVDNKASSDFVMLPYATPAETQAAVVEMVAERIPERYGLDASQIMVIAPLRDKGDLSVKELNRVLRARLNPEAVNCPDIWMGDRVIQRANSRELDVVNGDTGTVIEADADKLRIHFDTPEREVEAERSEFDLQLAYALTVHKAQGQQAPAVVFVVDPSGSAQYLAEAQLTYTGISRASTVCVAMGSRKALDAQVARHRAVNRYTRLAGMLRQD